MTELLSSVSRAMIKDMTRVKQAIMTTVDTLIKVGLEKKNDNCFVRSFVEREGDGLSTLILCVTCTLY